jgi:8-oxo-dGTP pyrophosphatase MutT (NUDIX family)
MFKNTIFIPGAKKNNGSSLCSNCGKSGHSFRQCDEPVLSYGIIVMRFTNPEWSLEKALCSSTALLNGTEGAGELQILMVQRKDSLRFVEFVRGKYLLKDPNYIKQLLSNMTDTERELVRTSTFSQLWNHVWGTPNPRSYRNDFEQSQDKFGELKRSGTLDQLLAETASLYPTPEWGFPKGRRNLYESDMDCAIRECSEETDLKRSQLQLFDAVEPLSETFYGDNKVFYSHKYYLALVAPGTEAIINPLNPHMMREIGAIAWLSVEEALARIRPENMEKRELLLRAFSIFKNLCPFRNARMAARYFSAASSE